MKKVCSYVTYYAPNQPATIIEIPESGDFLTVLGHLNRFNLEKATVENSKIDGLTVLAGHPNLVIYEQHEHFKITVGQNRYYQCSFNAVPEDGDILYLVESIGTVFQTYSQLLAFVHSQYATVKFVAIKHNKDTNQQHLMLSYGNGPWAGTSVISQFVYTSK